MCYTCHVMRLVDGVILSSLVVMLYGGEEESQQQACGEVCMEYVTWEGKRKGEGDVGVGREGHSSEEGSVRSGVSCGPVSPYLYCMVKLLNCEYYMRVCVMVGFLCRLDMSGVCYVSSIFPAVTCNSCVASQL